MYEFSPIILEVGDKSYLHPSIQIYDSKIIFGREIDIPSTKLKYKLAPTPQNLCPFHFFHHHACNAKTEIIEIISSSSLISLVVITATNHLFAVWSEHDCLFVISGYSIDSGKRLTCSNCAVYEPFLSTSGG